MSTTERGAKGDRNSGGAPTLVVFGDVLMEVLVQVDEIPRLGEDAVVTDLSFLPGGSAANCAAAAAHLGIPVRFLGTIGRDTFEVMLRRDLEEFGVDAGGVRQTDVPTSVVVTMINRGGERTFLSFRGGRREADYGPLPASVAAPGDILHLSGYSFQTPLSRNTALHLIETGRRVGAKISLDPSFHFAREGVKKDADVLNGLDFLFPNELEACLITSVEDSAEAAKSLLEMGVRNVVVKLGAEGCLVATRDGVLHVPTYPPTRVVDTTGAGDAFAGAFLAGMMKGCSLREAALVGHAAARMVIASVGGHRGAPTVGGLKAAGGERGDAMLLDALGKMENAG